MSGSGIDWSYFGTAPGIGAILSPLASFVAVLIGTGIASATTRSTHAARIKTDKELAEQRAAAEISLLERKFELDANLARQKVQLDARLTDRKRRQELAEEVLSRFYQVRDTVRAIRSPFGFEGEAKDRIKAPDEPQDVSRRRDTFFAIIARFEARRKEIADLLALRDRMRALFGAEAAEPFELVNQALNNVLSSARLLVQWAGEHINHDLTRKMEGDVWAGASNPDEVATMIETAIHKIEEVCRPVLSEAENR